jgi:predicted nucleic acid-binding protein
MMRLFVDANVFFTAALSATGASREIIRLGTLGTIILIVSELVLEEAERNLAAKRPDALPLLQLFLAIVPFEIVEPTKQEVLAAANYTVLKDAPVVAAAMRANVDFLVTLDRKHLVGVPEVAQESGLRIVLPEELLEEVRSAGGADKR